MLPLLLSVLLLELRDVPLALREVLAHLLVAGEQLLQPDDLLLHLLVGLNDHIVVGLFDILFAIGGCLSDLLLLEVSSQSANHVHVESRDVTVVVMYVLVLLVMLGLQVFDGLVLARLDLCNLLLALQLHDFAQARHLSLVLLANFAADALMLLALSRGLGIKMAQHGVTEFRLADLLLLGLDFERAQVLFELSFVDAVLVLHVLKLDLSLLLDHSLLVQILEHEML